MLTLFLWFYLLSGLTKGFEFNEDFNKTLDHILKEVDRDNIANFLRNLTRRPHLGGTPAEKETAEFVVDNWKRQGLDEVHLTPYDVLLSYSDKEKPNYVRIHNSEDKETWKSQGRTKPIFSKEEFSDEVYPDFNAYSPSGIVKGDVVFANFGANKDFQKLDELGVAVAGHIVIAKYGRSFRGNIAKAAQDRGATAVLLYPDPQQYAQEGPERVYPHTISMPGSAAPYGTVYLNDGDPLTPFYPSIESAFRIPEEEAEIPKIPVMPIGYDDASVILGKMSGAKAPEDWQGSLNLTYKLGPGLADPGWSISVEVNNYNQRTKTYNVIGVMKGKEEPDRYVILGNHRDAWIFGAVDPSSASAVMLELTRVLSEYSKETGWRPRRTLVFCSWGSEEYGLIGSQEWTEQFGKQIADRTVAYINLDMAIEGNYTLRTKSSPLLYDIAREITKMVPNPDPAENDAERTTVYDTWLFRKPDENRPGFPKFTGLGSGSDYKAFQHNLGIPSMEYRYTHSEEMFAEPLYHTLYETFHLTAELYDRGFHFHGAITQLWALIGSYLADEQIIPFSLDEYAMFIEDTQNDLITRHGAIIKERNLTLHYFLKASEKFKQAGEAFKEIISSVNKTNLLAVRRINDQLMLVEKAFIDPLGLPGRPFYNHVVFAPSSSDNYAAVAFAGLNDALADIETLPEDEQNKRWRTFEEHLSVCTHLLLSASKVLSDDLW